MSGLFIVSCLSPGVDFKARSSVWIDRMVFLIGLFCLSGLYSRIGYLVHMFGLFSVSCFSPGVDFKARLSVWSILPVRSVSEVWLFGLSAWSVLPVTCLRELNVRFVYLACRRGLIVWSVYLIYSACLVCLRVLIV